MPSRFKIYFRRLAREYRSNLKDVLLKAAVFTTTSVGKVNFVEVNINKLVRAYSLVTLLLQVNIYDVDVVVAVTDVFFRKFSCKL